jgi:hypothetical protein
MSTVKTKQTAGRWCNTCGQRIDDRKAHPKKVNGRWACNLILRTNRTQDDLKDYKGDPKKAFAWLRQRGPGNEDAAWVTASSIERKEREERLKNTRKVILLNSDKDMKKTKSGLILPKGLKK